jgi:hypothetical protein
MAGAVPVQSSQYPARAQKSDKIPKCHFTLKPEFLPFVPICERSIIDERNVAVLPSNSPSKWGLARAADKGFSPDSGDLAVYTVHLTGDVSFFFLEMRGSSAHARRELPF